MRKARIVSLATLIVVTFLLILPYIVEGFEWSIPELSVLYGLGLVTLVGYLWLFPTQQGNKSKGKTRDIGEIRTVTSITCHSCDFSQEREFKVGDYINKEVGKCRKCGKELYIRSIYSIEEQRK